MTTPKPHERKLLKQSEQILQHATERIRSPLLRTEARLQILEAAAASIGGFNYKWFITKIQNRDLVDIDHRRISTNLIASFQHLSMAPAFALAALFKPDNSITDKKKAGTYYTDHRIAQYVVHKLPGRGRVPTICDPACGAGSLLVAAVKQVAGADRRRRARALADRVFAYDKDPLAARACVACLSSLTQDRSVIRNIASHVTCTDALLDVYMGPLSNNAPDFETVVANPPWERLKATRHEALLALGVSRHYGSDYGVRPLAKYLDERRSVREYIAAIDADYTLQGSGERDLYKIFLELALRIIDDNGTLALVLPAGLIRSEGSSALRNALLSDSDDLELTLLDNKHAFFAIDSRFKFVLLNATFSGGNNRRSPVALATATASHEEIRGGSWTYMGRRSIAEISPGLTIPEVRKDAEWRLLKKLYRHGIPFGSDNGVWRPTFCREFDMTSDRGSFVSHPRKGALPLIEGRMVHQYRYGAKRYISGSGRAARWVATPYDSKGHFRPQFWIPHNRVPDRIDGVYQYDRVGFCDVTGQTNERSMLASRIPGGTVCGNKVPTIIFRNDAYNVRLSMLWLGIVNSFVFDWIVRRHITTSINYFILRELPMPAVRIDSLPARRVAEIAKALSQLAQAPARSREELVNRSQNRADVEILVASMYSLSAQDLELILEDFPLLDRGQPTIWGEQRSTVTRDFILERAHKRLVAGRKSKFRVHATRSRAALGTGALPFVAADFVGIYDLPSLNTSPGFK